MDRPGNHTARTLPGGRARPAGSSAQESDFRHACARRHRGSGVFDRCDEGVALLPAPHPGAHHQLTFLDWPQHRAEVVPERAVAQLPPHGRPADVRDVCRLREDRARSRQRERDSRRIQDLVGHSATPSLPDPRVPALRHVHARR